MSDSSAKFTTADWDAVRLGFASSIMVDTSLVSLAQNLDGPDWPIKAKDETPAAYIDLSYEEMRELLAMKGFPEHADLLISILKDTMSFDEPFGEMVQQTEAASAKDNQLLKNMEQLGLPEDFPIELTALDADTQDFCRLEGLGTLGQFARFAQKMSQNVIVGGDFRKLLNALSHVDETTLAQVLPFRVGTKGLHLIECLAQSPGKPERDRAAMTWFGEEFNVLQKDLAGSGNLARQLMVLNDAAAEQRVAAILRTEFGKAAGGARKKTGILGALARLLGR